MFVLEQSAMPKANKPAVAGALALTINQFCHSIPISRATYFKLKQAGKGPREMLVGGAVRISLESARAWIKERERERAG